MDKLNVSPCFHHILFSGTPWHPNIYFFWPWWLLGCWWFWWWHLIRAESALIVICPVDTYLKRVSSQYFQSMYHCIIVAKKHHQWITGFWFYWKGDGELHLHNFTNQKGSAVTRDGQIFQLKHILSISTRKQSARKEDGPLTGSSFKVSNWFLQISSFDPCHSTNLSGGLAWQSKNKDNKW